MTFIRIDDNLYMDMTTGAQLLRAGGDKICWRDIKGRRYSFHGDFDDLVEGLATELEWRVINELAGINKRLKRIEALMTGPGELTEQEREVFLKALISEANEP